MAGAVGRSLTAFSRRLWGTNLDTGAAIDVQFVLRTITMGGFSNDPQYENLSLGNSNTIEDITGDNSTNPNMFVGSTNEPNFTQSSSGSYYSTNVYVYANLPDVATERTYRITFGTGNPSGIPTGTTKEITLMVGGQNFFERSDGSQFATDVSPTAFVETSQDLGNHNIVKKFIANVPNAPSGQGTVWEIDQSFVNTDINNSLPVGIMYSSQNVMDATYCATNTNNSIPDLVFYTKKWTDEKNTFTDYRFRPDTSTGYASETHTLTHPANGGLVPRVKFASEWMNKELDEDSQSPALDSQYYSFHSPTSHYVPNTHFSVIIVNQKYSKSAAIATALNEANNAAYSDIFSEVVKASTYDFTQANINGYAMLTWPAHNFNPCDETIFTIVAHKTDEQTYQGNDGECYVTYNGGITPLTYIWTDSSNNQIGSNATIQNLSPGTYTVRVTDAQGCWDEKQFTILANTTVPCNFSLSFSQQNIPGTCGEVEFNTFSNSGIPAGTTWDWEILNPAGTQVVNGTNTSPPTSYNAGTINNNNPIDGVWTFIIELAGGVCKKIFTLAVTTPSTPSITMTSTDVTVNGGSDGTATATVSGGTSPYTYLWSNGGTTSTITGLTPGTYTCYVTDANGCTDEAAVVVSEPQFIFPAVSPLDVCIDLNTDKFVFTDNQNYLATGTSLPYKIAITVKLVNTSATIQTGNLSSPDIYIDNDIAALRTYNTTTKYGTNNSITILSGGNLYNDIYEITFDWNFSGGTAVDATYSIKLNALNIKTFKGLSISSSMTYNCNDDIINSLDSTNYSINSVPYTFTRTHSLSPPNGSGLASPVLSSSASALNYTGLEIGVWSNSISSSIQWDFPGNANYKEYCILLTATKTDSVNVLCYVDPCVLWQCVEKVRDKLERAECNCDENDIKKYRHILKRTGHLLAMFGITQDCSSLIVDYMLLYDIIDLTDCGCDCECPDGCDG